MVGKSQGVLEMQSKKQEYKVLFETSDGFILSVLVKDYPNAENPDVCSLILEFLKQPEASFEFRREERIVGGMQVSLRIDAVLLECMCAWDEMATAHPELPHLDTVFESKMCKNFISNDLQKDIELVQFWLMVEPLLRRGCSGCQIQAILSLNTEEILINLEKLYKLGYIAPAQRFIPQPKSSQGDSNSFSDILKRNESRVCGQTDQTRSLDLPEDEPVQPATNNLKAIASKSGDEERAYQFDQEEIDSYNGLIDELSVMLNPSALTLQSAN